MDLYTLSDTELRRLKRPLSIIDKRMSVVDAEDFLKLSGSQVHRLLTRYKSDEVESVAYGKRGKPSNRRYSDGYRDYALELVRLHFADFGPTFALEKLVENHDISVSKETLRQWMTGAGIWKTRILTALEKSEAEKYWPVRPGPTIFDWAANSTWKRCRLL